MTSETKSQIVEYIRKNEKVRPADLVKWLGLSAVIIHRHLKDLSEKGLIQKAGKPPLVFYLLAPVSEPSFKPTLDPESIRYLEQHYCYVTPEGVFQLGADGFFLWLAKTGQMKQAAFLAREFVKVRETAEVFRSREGWISGLQKFETTFPRVFLDQVYYQDFYSLPKFGRTRLGHELLLAKQAQNVALIKKMAHESRSMILKIIQKNKINAIAWTPHSIPRKVPFLKEYRRHLDLVNLGLSEVEIVKAYTGDIPIPQKSLSKLEERIENAKKTIFVRSIQSSQTRILLIDDAVGSGATLNETAAKLKVQPCIEKIIGFVLVGSYKGFDVIKEV